MDSHIWFLQTECPNCGTPNGLPDSPALIEKCTECGNAVLYPWSG